MNRRSGALLILVALTCASQQSARQPAPSPDADRDGIPDAIDQCPDEPEDHDGFEDQDGCPDPDNDRDHVLDEDDQCPNVPEDLDGFEDRDGCPDPDNDKDRIPDERDKCPNEPEIYNGIEDDDGCPEPGPVFGPARRIEFTETLRFRRGQSRIEATPHDAGVLDDVAAALKANSWILVVGVVGHAGAGEPDRLAEARARAVMTALMARGVAAGRLRALGRGKQQPLCTERSEACQSTNRRVQFELIDCAECPH